MLKCEINKFSNTNLWYPYLQTLDISTMEEFLENEVATYSPELSIFPPPNLIFNAFTITPLQNIKVCIIGQDPYHNIGQAMGLCFSVPKNIKIPPSLVNIYKELKNDLKNDFTIPTHGDLTHWAEQGVFLLNASLTVRQHCPNSHYKEWNKITTDIIRYISNETQQVVFLLWGNFAQNKSKLIDTNKHYILEAKHPSPLSANKGGWFGCQHFSKTNELLVQHNKTPIDWNL